MELSRASLHLVEQKAVSVESSPEGNVHVAVKNSPFSIQLGLVSDGAFMAVDLRQFTFDVSLVYKQPGPEKEVDYINVKPIESKQKFNEPTGDRVTLDCKISVLTSQHEDTLFLVKVVANVPQTPFHFSLYSEPIKVVSKTIQVKKQTKTRVTSESILQKSQEIEQLQAQVTGVLSMITQKQTGEAAPTSSAHNQGLWTSRPTSSSTAAPFQAPPAPAIQQNSGLATLASGALYPDEDNFDNSLQRFITCYRTLSSSEKVTRVEVLRSQFSKADNDLLELFLAQIQQYIREHSCSCRPCPYEPQTQDRYDLEYMLDNGLDQSLDSLFASPP